MNLSRNFTLSELTRTDTNLPNSIEPDIKLTLFYLCQFILQPIRDKWGPYETSSGYRSSAVNSAVGGSPTSQHLVGEAHDGRPKIADTAEVFEWIVKESGIAYGQVILESRSKGFIIHISMPRLNEDNNKALIEMVVGGEKSYVPYDKL